MLAKPRQYFLLGLREATHRPKNVANRKQQVVLRFLAFRIFLVAINQLFAKEFRTRGFEPIPPIAHRTISRIEIRRSAEFRNSPQRQKGMTVDAERLNSMLSDGTNLDRLQRVIKNVLI